MCMNCILCWFDGWLFVLLVFIVVGVVGYFFICYGYVVDWIYGGCVSLLKESCVVLVWLSGLVEIVSYVNLQGNLCQIIVSFVQCYQQVKLDILLCFVDLQFDFGVMCELGIIIDGELVIYYCGYEQWLDDFFFEGLMINVFECFVCGGECIVVFVSGDGECCLDGQVNVDLGIFMIQLEGCGMCVVLLNFVQVSVVLQYIDLVVLVSFIVLLLFGGVWVLVNYVCDGGNLLWFIELCVVGVLFVDDLGLQLLVDVFGISVLFGVFSDVFGVVLGLVNLYMIVLGDYLVQVIICGFMLIMLFFEVVVFVFVVGSSDWLSILFFCSGLQGCIDIGSEVDIILLGWLLEFGFVLICFLFSFDKGQQCVVVIGDGDFFFNIYLGNGGNCVLGECIFDWLLGDDVLVNLLLCGVLDCFLQLLQGQLNVVSLGFFVILLLFFLVIGGWIVW